jgi:hypothetical protein
MSKKKKKHLNLIQEMRGGKKTFDERESNEKKIKPFPKS